MVLLTATEVCRLNYCGMEMSNFDHVIDEGLEEKLKEGGHYGKHSAGNFNGDVWFQDGQFHEWVWRYGSPRYVVSADTLSGLMEAVNAQYGGND